MSGLAVLHAFKEERHLRGGKSRNKQQLLPVSLVLGMTVPQLLFSRHLHEKERSVCVYMCMLRGDTGWEKIQVSKIRFPELMDLQDAP